MKSCIAPCKKAARENFSPLGLSSWAHPLHSHVYYIPVFTFYELELLLSRLFKRSDVVLRKGS